MRNKTLKLNTLNIGGGQTDFLKFAMCVLIINLHTAKIGVLLPILRCAVPIFFMISSYFFFKKYDREKNVSQQNVLLKRYVKRNLQLYLFWAVLFFPFIIFLRKWFDSGVLLGLVRMCRAFLFSSTFPASWYIIASVLGVTFFSIMGRYFSNRSLLIFSVCAYVFCCITSNYGALFIKGSFAQFYEQYQTYLSVPYNSFPVSFIWIGLGRYIAKKEQELSKLNIVFLQRMLGLSFILLYAEYWMINHFGWEYTNDCYFMLVPTCFLALVLFCRYDYNLPQNLFLRKTSTIAYCSHLTIEIIFAYVLKYLGVELMSGFHFLFTLICSLILSYVFIKLEPSIKILRFSY